MGRRAGKWAGMWAGRRAVKWAGFGRVLAGVGGSWRILAGIGGYWRVLWVLTCVNIDYMQA